MLLTREFGYNGLIGSWVLQRDISRRTENIHHLFQEFGGEHRSTTIEADLQFNCDSFAVKQGHRLAIADGFDGKLERILLELEKMTQSVKQLSKQHLSDQRAFLEALIEWIALKPTSFRSINYP
jgi:hypothetical protein